MAVVIALTLTSGRRITATAPRARKRAVTHWALVDAWRGLTDLVLEPLSKVTEAMGDECFRVTEGLWIVWQELRGESRGSEPVPPDVKVVGAGSAGTSVAGDRFDDCQGRLTDDRFGDDRLVRTDERFAL